MGGDGAGMKLQMPWPQWLSIVLQLDSKAEEWVC